MSSLSLWRSSNAALLALGLTVGGVAPIVISAPATAANFVDVQGHWARPFIEALAAENILSGYSDRTFRPDQPVTRAQFAAMIEQAFDENNVQLSQKFDSEAADYWASRDFTNGRSSNRQLRLSDQLSKVQVLVALANGLRLYPSGSVANTLNFYTDASRIPEYARDSVAAATQKGIVVNYPDVADLEPSKAVTRADVAAFIYQALVNEGVLAPISSRMEASEYIVQVTPRNNQATNNRSSNQATNNRSSNQATNNRNTRTFQHKVSRGTAIDVEYQMSDKVIVAPGETRTMTLLVAEDIKNSRGEILIPKDSEIEGQIVPRYSGSSFLGAQFVAQRVIIGDESYDNINATSSVLTSQQPTNASPRTLGGTAINILTGILTGRSSNTNNQQEKTITIDPETDLQLTLGSDFYVNTISQAQTQ
ncbi:MAG: S-layer homology domain-containing protein [Coleofasciculus sp. C3-bin4]|nr:S-layer homology domain-containing protein [Coleofasciculus sp. C3-bin4]